MITIKKGGATATIDEDFTIASNDESLREDLQLEVDFAQMQSGYEKPVFVVLYDELKTNPNYEVDAPDEVLKSYIESQDNTERIF